ncbi:hypothetical protein [uncultured Shewanella sp.]|uniref:hypothetical protein n=1 Tax=Shewanella atlantica TaxID=271099 RepID=UPI0026243E4C|nr:hypothetical protein [uncultured Shewanella sp.]
MGLRRLVIFFLSLSSLTACTQDPQWTLFYYADSKEIPDSVTLSKSISGYYATSEQCIAKGRGLIRLSDSGVGSFQCGHLCVATDDGELTCDSMLDSLQP